MIKERASDKETKKRQVRSKDRKKENNEKQQEGDRVSVNVLV